MIQREIIMKAMKATVVIVKVSTVMKKVIHSKPAQKTEVNHKQ